MRKFAALGAIAALGLSSQAMADGFSYNLVEASYLNSEISDIDVDGDGFSVAGSVELHRNFFASASYSDLDLDGVDLSLFNLGLGFNWSLSPAVDVVSGVTYERMKVASMSSESGFGVNVGLRGRVAERFELTGNVKYVDFGSGADDMVFSAGGRYYFTDAFAAGIDYSKYDDLGLSSWQLALRYDFGRRN